MTNKKKLNIEELKELVFNQNKADKRNKDRLFKLAKANDDLETIEKLRDDFGFKGAIKFLLTLEEISIKELFLNIDLISVENAINNGIDINIQNEQGMSFLHFASENDNKMLVKYLIDNNANIDIQDKKGATPLLLASQNNNYEIIEILIKNKAKLELKCIYGYTPLLSAAALYKNVEPLNLLIKSGANINVQDNLGVSPLIIASQNNHEGIVKILLANQANPNLINDYGYNALHIPCEKGHENIVELLLNTKIDLNLQDKDGDTPLILASSNNHSDIVKLLVNNHANVNLVAKDKATALGFSFKNHNKKLTKFLINHGANTIPVIKEKKLNSILLNACVNGDEELIQLLLDNGANINYKNEYGNTPLILASGTADNIDIVEILIKNNADVNLTNNSNWSALLNASKHGHIDIAKLLLEHKANPNTKDCDGVTALYRVISDRIDMNDLHITTMKKADKNDITFRVSRLWLKYNANPNIKNEDESTVLNLCARIGDIEMVELLLDYGGAKMDMQDAFGITPLMSAVGANYLNVVKILLKYGANINQKSSRNYTTGLTCAIENNNLEMVKLLVKSGADLSIESSSVLKINQHVIGVRLSDMEYGTPEQIAKEYGFIEIENFLRTQNEINKKNKTIEIIPKGKIQLEHNLSIEIYKNYLLFQSKVGNEIFENRYNKEAVNNFFNQDKGYIAIGKNNVKKTSLFNEIIDYPFTNYSGIILDIDENHNPQALSKILQKFSSNEKLKYSNHTWDSTLSYDDFMKDLKKEFDEMSDELEILSPTLYENINKFLFIDDEKYVGWSSQIIKEEITKGVLPNNIELDTTNQDFKTFIEAIDNFKSLFVIKQNDKKLKLLKKFTKIRKELKEENLLEIILNLDNLKEDRIDKFFTDTQRLEKALKLILIDINENVKEDRRNVIVEANIEKSMIVIKIIHVGSTTSKSADGLKETISKNGGNFKSIFDNLTSVCDWSIDTICSDRKRYKIDYLYPELKNNEPICTQIDDNPRGFTHILRFYV